MFIKANGRKKIKAAVALFIFWSEYKDE